MISSLLPKKDIQDSCKISNFSWFWFAYRFCLRVSVCLLNDEYIENMIFFLFSLLLRSYYWWWMKILNHLFVSSLIKIDDQLYVDHHDGQQQFRYEEFVVAVVNNQFIRLSEQHTHANRFLDFQKKKFLMFFFLSLIKWMRWKVFFLVLLVAWYHNLHISHFWTFFIVKWNSSM